MTSRIILLNLVLSVISLWAFAKPVYAITACQNVQQAVDWYLKNPPNNYCKYTPEFGATEIKIWRDCDSRSTAPKTITYSAGSIDSTYTGTAQCCYVPTGCYYYTNPIRTNYTYETYTNINYKTLENTEYCDGHTATREYSSIGYNGFHFNYYQGTCGNPSSWYTSPPQVVQQVLDCSQYVTHYLIGTISIPSDCDDCFGSTDPCCGSKDPCCGSKDPCCGNPVCDDCR